MLHILQTVRLSSAIRETALLQHESILTRRRLGRPSRLGATPITSEEGEEAVEEKTLSENKLSREKNRSSLGNASSRFLPEFV